MIYVESPNILSDLTGKFSVFLAGGITGCPEFQTEICQALKSVPDDLVIFNPRRKDFPIYDPSAAQDQITWEFNALRQADLITFWFPKETLCPIVLLELGSWIVQKKPLVIGCHPDYARKQDVEIQASLARPGLPIFDNLEDIIMGIKFWYGQRS